VGGMVIEITRAWRDAIADRPCWHPCDARQAVLALAPRTSETV